MLSVIIPFFNSEKFLPRCFESLRAQKLKEIEYIFVDDGSTDNGVVRCLELINADAGFTLIKKENGGSMSAWLAGLDHVEGDYVGFVDVDDYIEPEMFAEMYSKAKQNNADIVMCNRRVVYKDRSEIAKRFHNEGYYAGKAMELIHSTVFPDENFRKMSNSRWDKIYKTDLYKSNVKYCIPPVRHSEDRHIVPACMFNANSFYYIDIPMYNYVQIAGAASTSISADLSDILARLYLTQKKMMIEKGFYDKYAENLKRSVVEHMKILIFRNLKPRGHSRIKRDTIKAIIYNADYREMFKKYSYKFNVRDRILLKTLFTIKNPFLSLVVNNVFNFVSGIYSGIRKKNIRYRKA